MIYGNLDKTKVVVFKRGGRLSKKEKWFFKDVILETVSSYKYLGVIFTNKLVWFEHTSNAADQAKKLFLGITRHLHNLSNLSYETFFKIFDTKISPVLLYGSEVWGFYKSKAIELVHLYACKRFLGVKQCTNNVMVYGECGRYPLYVSQNMRIIKYWLKLLSMPCYRLPKKCYNMMLLYESHGAKNWVYKVKCLLNECGFGYVWENQCPPRNIDSFLLSIRQTLHDMYIQNWNSIIVSSSKCYYYKLFKSTLTAESYLFDINIRKYKLALTRFRCSGHKLMIEVGRQQHVPKELRFCKQCKLNEIEDEYHFLLVCAKYNDLRTKYLDKCYCVHPTIEKIISLLSSTHVNTIRKLSMFIHNAMAIRN